VIKLNHNRPTVGLREFKLRIGDCMTLKDKIVDAAYELFGLKGYEHTSVAEIIEKAGASKGGFYHHFKSKEEILETITFNYIDMIRVQYDGILADRTLTVIEKFVESYYRLNAMKVESVKDWDKIRNLYTFKDNHILLKKMGEAFEKETARYFKALIEQGNKLGVFDVTSPKALAALWAREVIRFQQMTRYVLFRKNLTEEDYFETLVFNEQLINHQLGLEKNTIQLRAMADSFLASMKEQMEGKVK